MTEHLFNDLREVINYQHAILLQSKLALEIESPPTIKHLNEVIESFQHCDLKITGSSLNIAKGTTDPRVEFCLPR